MTGGGNRQVLGHPLDHTEHDRIAEGQGPGRGLRRDLALGTLERRRVCGP
ncbi:MAG: hypothetical protein BWZ02_03163 [Lentisphaerae bacterium ADurb.BinA184]|nr:MAG: hypothetical protein BWZ02_03163 [Lentisphaerae bacterium ADurb.BinA184]